MFGKTLVLFQFAFILLIAVRSPVFGSIYSLVIFALGMGFGAWAYFSIGVLNFRILPGVPEQNKLVTKGPYQYVRHPMYTMLFLMGVACLWVKFDLINIVLYMSLVVVLLIKARCEEKILIDLFPEYRNYIKNTNQFFPITILR
jgi:protein-S-isoprenylcysteine O-methyltransferase Ste14